MRGFGGSDTHRGHGRVPAGTLRDRDADVLAPEVMVRRHAGYRNRVLMGPTWRADVWTVLEEDSAMSVAHAARRAGCSFATAWQVVQDFRLLRDATSGELEGADEISPKERGRSAGGDLAVR